MMSAISAPGAAGSLPPSAAAARAAGTDAAHRADLQRPARVTAPGDPAKRFTPLRFGPEDSPGTGVPGALLPARLQAAAPEPHAAAGCTVEPGKTFAAMLARIEAAPTADTQLALDISLPGAGLEPAPVATVARAADGGVSLILHHAPQHVPLPPLLQAAQQRLRTPLSRLETSARRPGADGGR